MKLLSENDDNIIYSKMPAGNISVLLLPNLAVRRAVNNGRPLMFCQKTSIESAKQLLVAAGIEPAKIHLAERCRLQQILSAGQADHLLLWDESLFFSTDFGLNEFIERHIAGREKLTLLTGGHREIDGFDLALVSCAHKIIWAYQTSFLESSFVLPHSNGARVQRALPLLMADHETAKEIAGLCSAEDPNYLQIGEWLQQNLGPENRGRQRAGAFEIGSQIDMVQFLASKLNLDRARLETSSDPAALMRERYDRVLIGQGISDRARDKLWADLSGYFSSLSEPLILSLIGRAKIIESALAQAAKTKTAQRRPVESSCPEKDEFLRLKGLSFDDLKAELAFLVDQRFNFKEIALICLLLENGPTKLIEETRAVPGRIKVAKKALLSKLKVIADGLGEQEKRIIDGILYGLTYKNRPLSSTTLLVEIERLAETRDMVRDPLTFNDIAKSLHVSLAIVRNRIEKGKINVPDEAIVYVPPAIKGRCVGDEDYARFHHQQLSRRLGRALARANDPNIELRRLLRHHCGINQSSTLDQWQASTIVLQVFEEQRTLLRTNPHIS